MQRFYVNYLELGSAQPRQANWAIRLKLPPLWGFRVLPRGLTPVRSITVMLPAQRQSRYVLLKRFRFDVRLFKLICLWSKGTHFEQLNILEIRGENLNGAHQKNSNTFTGGDYNNYSFFWLESENCSNEEHFEVQLVFSQCFTVSYWLFCKV